MGNIEKFTRILQSFHQYSEQFKISDQDRVLFDSLNYVEIAKSLREVVESGVGIEKLWLLWQINKNILPDQSAKLRAELPDNHVLMRTLAEHDLSLCYIADLDQVNNEIQKLDFASSYTQEIRRLELIASHLVKEVQHREREENIIFPELHKRGYADILHIITNQHIELRRAHENLKEVAWNIDKISFTLDRHIFPEQMHCNLRIARIYLA